MAEQSNRGVGVGLKPYYSHGGVTIYHGDCRDILGSFHADVMVSDPPYGMGYESGWKSTSRVANDDTPAVRDAALSFWGDRPALIFGRWSVPRPARTRMLLIWDKGDWPGMGDLSLPWGPSTEEIYVLGSGFVGKRGGQVLRSTGVVRGGAHALHPTEKPVDLMRQLVRACPHGVIVDPFMGSGSTLRAAKDEQRQAVGVELEERYCEIAAKRLAQEVLF